MKVCTMHAGYTGDACATTTESGSVHLRNLIVEYHLGKKMSENKLAELDTLLLILYYESGNLIHGKIFNEIDSNFKKHSDKGKKFLVNSIATLHENGFIKMNPEHKPSYGGIG